MEQSSFKFFDASEGEKLKEAGMSLAASNKNDILTKARLIAVEIAKRNGGHCSADDVRFELTKRGFNSLGPAAGSLFKSVAWKFTGERIKSKFTGNHAREIKVWRYVGCL